MGQHSGGGFQPGSGFSEGFPGGSFHIHSQASAEELFRQVFGTSSFSQIFAQMTAQPRLQGLARGSEVQVLSGPQSVLAACREVGIDETDDALRLRTLGKRGCIIEVNLESNSVQVNVPEVGDVWLAAKALRPPKGQQTRPSPGFEGLLHGGFGGASRS